MRVAIVYDCLYPYTIGGAERWYRDLGERLTTRHEVTYLTRRQWDGDAPPDPPSFRVVAVGGARALYTPRGRRRILPPLAFGLGVLRHLALARGRYDVVHACGFPYFSALAAGFAETLGGPPVVTDWFEVWPRRYWREYLGAAGGAIGEAVQRLAVRRSRRVFALSRLHAARLKDLGTARDPVVLSGLYSGGAYDDGAAAPRKPLVVFVGRHIPEKRIPLVPQAVAIARRTIPDLRAIVFGDGPERPRVLAEVARLGLERIVECPGFAPWPDVDRALRHALCLVLPSCREGYGLSIVEAAARGTPSIVTRDPDSAAEDLVEHGVNGLLVGEARPEAIAAAIVALHEDRGGFGERTRAWFAAHREGLSIESSVAAVERAYADAVAGR